MVTVPHRHQALGSHTASCVAALPPLAGVCTSLARSPQTACRGCPRTSHQPGSPPACGVPFVLHLLVARGGGGLVLLHGRGQAGRRVGGQAGRRIGGGQQTSGKASILIIADAAVALRLICAAGILRQVGRALLGQARRKAGSPATVALMLPQFHRRTWRWRVCCRCGAPLTRCHGRHRALAQHWQGGASWRA